MQVVDKTAATGPCEVRCASATPLNTQIAAAAYTMTI